MVRINIYDRETGDLLMWVTIEQRKVRRYLKNLPTSARGEYARWK